MQSHVSPELSIWIFYLRLHVTRPLIILILSPCTQLFLQIWCITLQATETWQVIQQILGRPDSLINLYESRKGVEVGGKILVEQCLSLRRKLKLYKKNKFPRLSTLASSCRTNTMLLTTSGRFLPLGGALLPPVLWTKSSRRDLR